jgi:hypothetical protein
VVLWQPDRLCDLMTVQSFANNCPDRTLSRYALYYSVVVALLNSKYTGYVVLVLCSVVFAYTLLPLTDLAICVAGLMCCIHGPHRAHPLCRVPVQAQGILYRVSSYRLGRLLLFYQDKICSAFLDM